MNPHVQLFFDMMRECYGVNGWKYDRNLNVQFTNSKSPNLQKLLLLGFDRDKAILEHAATSDVPMIISDNLGLMWGIVEQKTGKPENIGDFYVLCRVHHEKCWAGRSTSWNQDYREKYQ